MKAEFVAREHAVAIRSGGWGRSVVPARRICEAFCAILALIGAVGCSKEPAGGQQGASGGATTGSGRAAGGEVVVYTSIDQQFAQQVLAAFEREAGIRVKPVYDTEAGKTTGLVRRLFQERTSPRCDVWWSSEVFGTLELARAGVLQAYDSPAAADIPAAWKDRARRWTAIAPRARVLAYRADRPPFETPPADWRAVAEWPAERLARGAIANPQFGTTRGHVAAQFAFWGDEAATEWLRKLRAGRIQIADGNAHAIRMVESGQADWCLTDSDDVLAGIQRGAPLMATVPALTSGAESGGEASSAAGGLWIPCSVALVRGGPNPEPAKRLYDYLVSAGGEEALARSDSANVPVRAAVVAALRAEQSGGPAAVAPGDEAAATPVFRDRAGLFALEPAAVDFEKVADALERSGRAAREELVR
jgi:iron(III) transport system substrate-binding protein